MTDALKSLRRAAQQAALCTLPVLSLCLASCSSTEIEGVPANLPEIALSGSSATPPHHMATYEYPFDSGGNYVDDWAAEGEHRAGRSARATSEDERKWSGSHGGRATGASSPKKKRPGSTASKTKSATAAKSGASSKYVVKKGDTVERIARRYGVTVSRLKAANGLKSDLIRIGQTLRIPR